MKIYISAAVLMVSLQAFAEYGYKSGGKDWPYKIPTKTEQLDMKSKCFGSEKDVEDLCAKTAADFSKKTGRWALGYSFSAFHSGGSCQSSVGPAFEGNCHVKVIDTELVVRNSPTGIELEECRTRNKSQGQKFTH